MKLRILFVLILSMLCVDGFAQNVRIGAWNIEWLGVPGNRGNVGTNVAQSAADIADYIIASNVAVLGLEEVSDNGATPNTNKTITDALVIVKQRTGDTWKHVLFPKNGRDQHIGVAWNATKATMVGNPTKIQVPTSVDNVHIWDRVPHAVKFSFGNGKTDIVVIVLHMKANTGGQPSPTRKRELEAQTLVDKLPGLRSALHDQDIVIIGDSNILRFNESADQIYRAAGFTDLNSADRPTHMDGGAFDRAFIPNQTEFNGADQAIFDTEFLVPKNLTRSKFRRRFSDHFMAITRVTVMNDDD
jgi:hypothetical protein